MNCSVPIFLSVSLLGTILSSFCAVCMPIRNFHYHILYTPLRIHFHAVLGSARKLLIISTINVKCSTGGRCGNGRGKLLSLLLSLLFYGNFSHAYLRITLLPRLNAKLHFQFCPGSSSENVFPAFSTPNPQYTPIVVVAFLSWHDNLCAFCMFQGNCQGFLRPLWHSGKL